MGVDSLVVREDHWEKSYPMTDTFEDLLACMKDFHQMFKDDYELDGVAISSCGSIDVENAVIDAVWALLFLGVK